MSHRDWLDDDAAGATTSFNDAANWSGAAVPASGDSWSINRGTRNVTAGLDQSAKDFLSCYLGRGFSGKFGNSESDMFKCGSAYFRVDGAGAVYLDAGGGGAYNIDDLVVDGISANRSGSGSFKGAIGNFVARAGRLRLLSGTSAQMIMSAYGNIDANLVVDLLDATITELHKGRGTFTLLEDSASGVVTTAHVQTSVLEALAGTITNLYSHGADCRVKLAQTANMTLLKVLQGVVDAAQVTVPRTYTTVHVGTQGMLLRGSNLTITNLKKFGVVEEVLV